MTAADVSLFLSTKWDKGEINYGTSLTTSLFGFTFWGFLARLFFNHWHLTLTLIGHFISHSLLVLEWTILCFQNCEESTRRWKHSSEIWKVLHRTEIWWLWMPFEHSELMHVQEASLTWFEPSDIIMFQASIRRWVYCGYKGMDMFNSHAQDVAFKQCSGALVVCIADQLWMVLRLWQTHCSILLSIKCH